MSLLRSSPKMARGDPQRPPPGPHWCEEALVRAGRRCHLRAELGSADIAGHFILVHLVHHQLVETLLPTHGEEDRLINSAPVLLYLHVVREETKVELVALGVGLLQDQSNARHVLLLI